MTSLSDPGHHLPAAVWTSLSEIGLNIWLPMLSALLVFSSHSVNTMFLNRGSFSLKIFSPSPTRMTCHSDWFWFECYPLSPVSLIHIFDFVHYLFLILSRLWIHSDFRCWCGAAFQNFAALCRSGFLPGSAAGMARSLFSIRAPASIRYTFSRFLFEKSTVYNLSNLLTFHDKVWPDLAVSPLIAVEVIKFNIYFLTLLPACLFQICGRIKQPSGSIGSCSGLSCIAWILISILYWIVYYICVIRCVV